MKSYEEKENFYTSIDITVSAIENNINQYAENMLNNLAQTQKRAFANKKFKEYYDIYYASGIYESRFFNWLYGNHICLIIFRKGDKKKGWITDPSLKVIKRCFEELNCYRDIINFNKVFSTSNSEHLYLIKAKFGSSIREELQVKEDTFTHYSASFNSYLPLLIYENKWLILAKFQRKKDKVWVEYYEQKENSDFEKCTLIDKHTTRYKQLYNHSRIFSLIDSLLAKISIIDDSRIDQHKKLVSAELEEDYMMILYYIELAIVQIFRKNPYLTDKVVANVLNDLINDKESKTYQLNYLIKKDARMHNELKNHIKSFNLECKCPSRILINALKKVLSSVNSFIKRSTSKDAYLNFIIGYYE